MNEKHRTDFQIALIGAGNMAWHLGHAFREKGISIIQVISRSIQTAKTLADELDCSFSDSIKNLNSDADIILVAVDDSNLKKVIREIKTDHAIVLHTSGSSDITVFTGIFSRYGVFYPFQTLTKGIPVDLSEVPICIEASDNNTLAVIRWLAECLTINSKIINSHDRMVLHLCGVLTNNFTNHLIARATDFMTQFKLDKELLIPLLKETIRKLELTSPYDAQTGPARRNNGAIINKHKELLSDEPELKKLYTSLTDSIIAYYK